MKKIFNSIFISSQLLIFCLILIFGIIFNSIGSLSAPYKFLPQTLTQPDGRVIHCFASGDEYYNWLHDKDGFTIIQDQKTGFYVWAQKINDELVPSNNKVGETEPSELNYGVWQQPAQSKLDLQLNQKYEMMKIKKPATKNKTSKILSNTVGSINNIVIFVKFSDDPEFNDPVSTYDNMFNQDNGNSLKNYYQEASYNQLTVNSTFYPAQSGSTIITYTDPHPRGYYQKASLANTIGYNSSIPCSEYKDPNCFTYREWNLVISALNWVNTNSPIPLSLNIDNDEDGYVDNVCFMIKGDAQGNSDLLWPHTWYLIPNTLSASINGKKIYYYNFQMEGFTKLSGVGVLSHEFFHTLGAPDMYHRLNTLEPVYKWDVMGITLNPPQHMGAYMKYKYGLWINNIPEIKATGLYKLKPLTSSTNNCYKIKSPNSTNQYYLLEYRKQSGTYESSVPGSGLVIYRINLGKDGEGDLVGPPDEVYIYRPNGTTTIDGNPDKAFFSSESGRASINSTTNPAPFLVDGSAGGLNICQIGSAGNSISFIVNLGPPGVATTVQKNITLTDAQVGGNVFTDGGNAVTTRGICFGTSLNPVIGQAGVSNIPYGSGGTGVFTSNITGLSANTVYHIRAYAINSAGTSYGDDIMFITSTTSTAQAWVDDDWAIQTDVNMYNPSLVLGTNAFNKIQAAVDALVDNGIINVLPGNYTDNININKQLTLLGAKTGIDARTRNTTDEESVIKGASLTIGANNVTIDGFSIQGYNGPGILSPNNQNIKLVNNYISGNLYGMNLGGSNIVIQNNLISNNGAFSGNYAGDGIVFDGSSSNVTITNNTFDNSLPYNIGSNSIQTSAGSSNIHTNFTIDNNFISNSGRRAIELEGAGGIGGFTITRNTIKNSYQYPDNTDLTKGAINIYDNTKLTGTIKINNNIITGSAKWGVSTGSGISNLSYMNLNYNNISSNTGGGCYNGTATAFNAKYNWWGACSGPYNASANSSGDANAVSNNITFKPWIGSNTFQTAALWLTPYLISQPFNQRVPRWKDASCYQSYGLADWGRAPFLVADQYAGLPAVKFMSNSKFTGISEGYGVPNSQATINAVSQKGLYVVFTTGADVTTEQVIFEAGGFNSGYNIYINANKIGFGMWKTDPTITKKYLEKPCQPNTTYFAYLEYTGTTFTAYLNGSTASTFFSGLTPDNTPNGIGAEYYGTRTSLRNYGETFGAFFTGLMYEVILFNDPANFYIAKDYICGKYAVTGCPNLSPREGSDGDWVEISDAEPIAGEINGESIMTQPYPSPFDASTGFSLRINKEQNVRIEIYNDLGKQVATLYNGILPAGSTNEFNLSGAGLQQGIYFIRAIGETFVQSAKVVHIK